MVAVEVVVASERGQLWLKAGKVVFVGPSGEKHVLPCPSCNGWMPYENGRRACSRRCERLLPAPERRVRVRYSPEE